MRIPERARLYAFLLKRINNPLYSNVAGKVPQIWVAASTNPQMPKNTVKYAVQYSANLRKAGWSGIPEESVWREKEGDSISAVERRESFGVKVSAETANIKIIENPHISFILNKFENF